MPAAAEGLQTRGVSLEKAGAGPGHLEREAAPLAETVATWAALTVRGLYCSLWESLVGVFTNLVQSWIIYPPFAETTATSI